jgi:hypothetical protein
VAESKESLAIFNKRQSNKTLVEQNKSGESQDP